MEKELDDEVLSLSLEMLRNDEIPFVRSHSTYSNPSSREEKFERKTEKQEVMFLNKLLKRNSQQVRKTFYTP